MAMHYIKKRHIDDCSFEDLDLDLYEEFIVDQGHDDELETVRVGRGRADGFPIKIDRMLEALTKLKEAGATHIEIDRHCDHIGYDISGFAITELKGDEIRELKAKQDAEKIREEKIRKLKNELRELENEKNPIDTDDLPF
jgi:hypothetical protein